MVSRNALLLACFLLGAPIAGALDTLTVGDTTYRNVVLKKEFPGSFFIAHEKGLDFVEREQLTAEQVAALVGNGPDAPLPPVKAAVAPDRTTEETAKEPEENNGASEEDAETPAEETAATGEQPAPAEAAPPGGEAVEESAEATQEDAAAPEQSATPPAQDVDAAKEVSEDSGVTKEQTAAGAEAAPAPDQETEESAEDSAATGGQPAPRDAAPPSGEVIKEPAPATEENSETSTESAESAPVQDVVDEDAASGTADD